MPSFLVADTQLYTLPCRSVGRSVGTSIRLSVTMLNCERFSHYRSCPTVRDWIAVYPALFNLVDIAQQNEIGQSSEKHNFHCTLRDHCSTISEGNWTKFMRFWKIFLCFLEWDRPKIFSPNRVKDMSFQSWMVKTPKSPTTTTTVIWHFSTKIPI